MLGTAIASLSGAAVLSTAIITTDQTVLRAAPRDSAQQQAVLRQGEMVEVRGERQDYLQVWDYQRERGGFVRASQVRRTALSAAEAPELLTVLRFVKDAPAQEALGIGMAAAWLKAAPAPMVQGEPGVEALETLGLLADRLASRASSGALPNAAAEANLAAQLDVARRYGVRFTSYEHDARMQICYDGEALRRVLAMAANPQQQARAALALSRAECADPALRPSERLALNEWRADVLDHVQTSALPGYLQNRVQMRRAGVWSALAFDYARMSVVATDAPAHETRSGAAAGRATAALGSVNKAELTDEDQATYNTAAMQVNASRWAAVAGTDAPSRKGVRVVLSPGPSGETCVLLVDEAHDAAHALLRRCTYAQVWPQSASLNREGNALALAVQPLPAWRELWLFRKQAQGWTVSVLPPATTAPEMGYAEFAGWVPGGKQLLVAREARGEGKYTRTYAVLKLESLTPERQGGDPANMGPFLRWQDPAWKSQSVSLR